MNEGFAKSPCTSLRSISFALRNGFEVIFKKTPLSPPETGNVRDISLEIFQNR